MKPNRPAVYSTGTWKPEDGVVPGFRESEYLHTNGYFQYPPNAGSTIEMRVRGDEGTEQFNLLINQQVVGTYNASTSFQTFSNTHGSPVSADDVSIAFINDQYLPEQGIDTNLIVDYMSIDGTSYQTEDPSVFSTGTWKPEDGIVPGYRESEFLHVNGYFQYASVSSSALVEVQARGDVGTEQFNLLIAGQVAATYTASTSLQTFKYTHNAPVTADDVRIEFINDQWLPDQSIDTNLTVDYLSIDGTVYQTEDPSVYSTGTWKAADSVTPGFRQSEVLHVNGYFQFASEQGPRGLSLQTSTATVTEGTPAIDLIVNRTGSTSGALSVDYFTEAQTAADLQDFVPVVGTLTFGDGQQTMTIRIPIVDDGQVEDDETFAVQLNNATSGVVLGTQRTVISILDNDQVIEAGSLTFTGPMATVNEGTGIAQIPVARVNGSTGIVSVDYFTSNDEASAGQDYVATSGTLDLCRGRDRKVHQRPHPRRQCRGIAGIFLPRRH